MTRWRIVKHPPFDSWELQRMRWRWSGWRYVRTIFERDVQDAVKEAERLISTYSTVVEIKAR